MLLMLEKGIREGICHSIYRKANNTYMTDYNKRKGIVIFSIVKCK